MKKRVLYMSVIILSSCGIKGPPLPPLKEETIQSQKSWDDVEKTTQSEPSLPKLKKFEIKKKPANKTVTNDN